MDRHGVPAPEPGSVPRLGQPDVDELAGQRVPDEDDPPVVPGDAVAAVRDRADPDAAKDVAGAHRSSPASPATPAGTSRPGGRLLGTPLHGRTRDRRGG